MKTIQQSIAIVITTAVIVGGAMYFYNENSKSVLSQKYEQGLTSLQEKNNQMKNSLDLLKTGDWQPYTYKKMSLLYPKGWEVVFDSGVANQPDGFAIHISPVSELDSLQPNGLWLSTYNDSRGTKYDYIKSQGKQFSTGKEYLGITFENGGTDLYAACANYPKATPSLDVCNKIISTVAITNQ